jgi:SPP1 family predicted phage head-tail adaptor
MKSGDLDRRIAIGQPEVIELGMDETKEGPFVPLATVWAAYEPVSDGERMRAAAVEQKTDARFTVRWSTRLSAINATYQIEFDGSYWEITGTKEIGRRGWLEITAWRLVQLEA